MWNINSRAKVTIGGNFITFVRREINSYTCLPFLYDRWVCHSLRSMGMPFPSFEGYAIPFVRWVCHSLRSMGMPFPSFDGYAIPFVRWYAIPFVRWVCHSKSSFDGYGQFLRKDDAINPSNKGYLSTAKLINYLLKSDVWQRRTKVILLKN